MPTSVQTKDVMVFRSSLAPTYHRWALDGLRDQQLDESAPHEAVPVDILHDPSVFAAVRDMLGPYAAPDPCRHIHLNQGGEAGPWHVDDYCGNPWPEGYRFAILAYFPQDTSVEMGPTAARVDGQEIVAAGPAGTCLLIAQHVEHRATANTSGLERYMLKYLFRSPR